MMEQTVENLGASLGSLARELITSPEDLAEIDVLMVTLQVGGATAIAALLQMAQLIGEAADDASAVPAALDRVSAESPLWLVACLATACFAATRADYPSRQDAQAARSAISARADIVYDSAGIFGAEVIAWLVSLAGVTVVRLSGTAAERSPAVRVETGVSLPSTLLAYDLYGSASRAGEIVDRNRIATSLVMPVSFEAVAE